MQTWTIARGLNKVWKNGKLGSLKFIRDREQPATIKRKEHGGDGKESWNFDAQLSYWILDENDNPMLPGHDKAIKAANRVSKTPAFGLMAEDWADKWWRVNAAVIIDNSGSTSMESGITHKASGHELTVLDRHVMTAAVYLTNFPKQGDYRIITSHRERNPQFPHARTGPMRDFDNTDDAIEYLFTLRSGGGGFSSRSYFK